MTAEKIIEGAIKKAQDSGIEIIRGPCFIWGLGDMPESCDWCGAVLLEMGLGKDFPAGWLKKFCDYLGKDIFWFRNFNYGFSQLRVLEVYREDDKTKKRVYLEDKVSKAAVKLAKRYCVKKNI